MKILAAEYVLPISAEPIRDGGVLVDGDVIAAVGPSAELGADHPDAELESFGHAAILPGFVNCHSHLEITAMRGYLDSVEHDFYSWLMKLTKTRSEVLSDADIEVTALAGAVEGARAGVTCFGDIGRYGMAGFEALRTAGLRGVLFQETEFSPSDAKADDDLAKLKDKFHGLRDRQTTLVEVGISPHSPYTVSRSLFEKIGRFAADENIKVTIHAAESAEEDDLIKRGDGYFKTIYENIGASFDSPRCSPVEFLLSTGILELQPLLAHCVRVSEKDIEIIAATGSKVAHCPKSNAKFGHGYAPLEKLLDAGVAVGLGSDSVASNNACDLIEEARFAALVARNRADHTRFISAAEVLKAATLGGAKALGMDRITGSLEAGKHADIAVLSLANVAQQPVNDISSAIVFSSAARDVVMTMVGGEPVFRDGRATRVDESELLRQARAIGDKIGGR
ncbi:MAG TPA: amidohydrolase family protein [Pyrinomonadaceae bacterium]|nr:amidohydrolase family protein [Pyrinomonadaceae bacterium]